MTNGEIFGQDLDLGFIADEEGRVFAGPYTRVDLQGRRRTDVAPRVTDLATVKGVANLVQSLIVRLKTERGELASLGVPSYGSRHHQLIGELNTEGNRNLVKLHVLECVRQDPRVTDIVQVTVRPISGRENRDKVTIDVTVRAIDAPHPLNFVVPFSFGGALE